MKRKRNVFIFGTLMGVGVIGMYLLLFQFIPDDTRSVGDHHVMTTGSEPKDQTSHVEQEGNGENKSDAREKEAEKEKAEDDTNQSEMEESDEKAFIGVSVATLWTEPDMDRAVDASAVGDPVNMWEWTESMSHADKEWLIGNLQTQALYGDAVTVIEEDEGWAKVAVHDQPAPDSELGYVAWMDATQLVHESSFAEVVNEENLYVVVTNPTAWLYNDEDLQASFMEVSYNTRLPVLKNGDGAVSVATPADGAKWISTDAVDVRKQNEDVPEPTGDMLVESAESFLGLPYLWAGTSGFGFDCSGFTYCVFQVNGITIPRDSSVQATHGTAVEKGDLEKGDLLFFADDNGNGFVHHVGIYMGNGQMIHAPNTDSTVETIDVFESEYWSNEYAGARRYID